MRCLICEKPGIIYKKLSFKEKCKKIFCYSKRLEKFPKLHTKKIKTIYPIINKKFYLSKNEGINNKDENILLVVLYNQKNQNFLFAN